MDLLKKNSSLWKHGAKRKMLICTHCRCDFSEIKNTFLYNLKEPINKVWDVINHRTEGEGLNAESRACCVAKNTIISWESKFTNLYHVLFLYSMTHCYLHLVIEGDEFYTKVKKPFLLTNQPVEPLSLWIEQADSSGI